MQANADPKQAEFLALYEPVHGQFARFCHARLATNQEAKDLISDTVLKAYENFNRLRHKEAFLHFLFGIAHNILLQKRRRGKFWGFFSEKEAMQLPDNGSQTDASAEVRLLYEALQKLPELQREAVILFEISGFSLAEIQQIQQASLSAVKSRIARGREKLVQLLRPEAKRQFTSAAEAGTQTGPAKSINPNSCIPAAITP